MLPCPVPVDHDFAPACAAAMWCASQDAATTLVRCTLYREVPVRSSYLVHDAALCPNATRLARKMAAIEERAIPMSQMTD